MHLPEGQSDSYIRRTIAENSVACCTNMRKMQNAAHNGPKMLLPGMTRALHGRNLDGSCSQITNGYLTWRLQMNRKIDRTVHPPRILRKTYWDEDEHQRWKGPPPAFEVYYDATNGFLLQVSGRGMVVPAWSGLSTSARGRETKTLSPSCFVAGALLHPSSQV